MNVSYHKEQQYIRLKGGDKMVSLVFSLMKVMGGA